MYEYLNEQRPRKVAIYARVSTEHEEQLSALENQIDWYGPIMAAHKEWDVVARYVDEGITGTSANKRPQFLKMIQDAKKGKFDLIITREVSRFARNTVDTLQYTRELRSHGVEVYFINDNIKTFDGDGELRLTIMATLAQDESRKTSIRVKAGQDTSMKNGTIYGNGNILGYDKVGDKVVINPEQARTVRLIYDLYLAGNGYTKIKYELEKRGIKTATGKTKWHAAAIRNIVINSFYCGIITYHKAYVPDYLVQKRAVNHGEIPLLQVRGTHETIVTEEEYRRALRISENRVTCKEITLPNGKIKKQLRGRTPSVDIWCRLGMCSCGKTINRLKYSKTSDGKFKYAYRCKGVIQDGSRDTRKAQGLPYEKYCNCQFVATWKLELMAYQVFKEYLPNADQAVNLAKDILVAHSKDSEPDESNVPIIKAKQAEREKLGQRFDRLLDMRTDGELTPEVFKKKANEVQKKIDELVNEIEELQKREEQRVTKDEYSDRISLICKRLEEVLDFSKYSDIVPNNIIEAFVDKVVFCEDHFEWYLKIGNDARNVYNDRWWSQIFSTGKVYGSSGSPDSDIRHINDSEDSRDFRVKVAEFEIGKEQAAKYIKKTQMGHHLKLNMWKDIKVRVFI